MTSLWALTNVPSTGTIEPNMGTTMNDNNIASVLFGKVRRAILAILFSYSDQEFYLRQIVRVAGVGQGAIQRELANLQQSGLILRKTRGRQVFFQANKESPVYPELRGLIIKTVGVADVLRASLAELADSIKVAFIYGSLAKGSERSSSDVDVMIVGDVAFGDVVASLTSAQDDLNREINPSVFSPEDFRQRVARVDHFITSVLQEPKVFLIGGDSELRKLAKSGMAGATRSEHPGDF